MIASATPSTIQPPPPPKTTPTLSTESVEHSNKTSNLTQTTIQQHFGIPLKLTLSSTTADSTSPPVSAIPSPTITTQPQSTTTSSAFPSTQVSTEESEIEERVSIAVRLNNLELENKQLKKELEDKDATIAELRAANAALRVCAAANKSC